MKSQMKHYRLCALIFSMLLITLITAAPVVATTAPTDSKSYLHQEGAYATVKLPSARVYVGPGLGFWWLGTLRRNEVVPVIGVSADGQFWQVNTTYGVGFVFYRHVNTANTEGIPVADVGVFGSVTVNWGAVRSGPGKTASQITSLRKNTQFFVIGRQPDNSWLEIRYRGGTGWIAASQTSLASEQIFAVEPSTQGPYAVVNADTLNVRTGPSDAFDIIGTLHYGETVAITGQSADGVWLQVSTPFGTGWINSIFAITKDFYGSAPVTGTELQPAVNSSGRVVTGNLNIRSGPNAAFEIIGTVPSGTILTIIGQSPDRGWWYVESPFGPGWVTKRYIRATAAANNTPIIGQ